MEGYTDFYRLGNYTLTAIRYQDEIPRPMSYLTVVERVLGSS